MIGLPLRCAVDSMGAVHVQSMVASLDLLALNSCHVTVLPFRIVEYITALDKTKIFD